MARAANPYGDGRAAGRIVGWLLARLRGARTRSSAPFTAVRALLAASSRPAAPSPLRGGRALCGRL